MALEYVWEGKTLAGWLSGFRALTSYVACEVITCLGEPASPGGMNCGPYPDFVLNTLAFALQLRKITENFSQDSRMALGRLTPNAIRLSPLPPRAVASIVCCPLPPLAFASSGRVSPREALVPAELPY